MAASACSEGTAELALGCEGTCDRAAPPSLGIESSPEAIRCEVDGQISELRCELVQDHPLVTLESVALQIETDDGTRPSGALLGPDQPSASVPLPPGATEVDISARYRLADATGLLGTDALTNLRDETTIVLGDGRVRATLHVPVDLWRFELLGKRDADLRVLAGETVVVDRVLVEVGSRLPLAVALPAGTDELGWTGTVAGEPMNGIISAPTVLNLDETGIEPATAEQIPEAPRGEIALTCGHDTVSERIQCSVPLLAADAVDKIEVELYGADGSSATFLVSSRFPTTIRVQSAQLPVTLLAAVPMSEEVFGLPTEKRTAQLRGIIDSDGTLDLHLPFSLLEVDISSEVDVAGLIVANLPLELGMTMPGWFEYREQADVELSMPASGHLVRLLMAVPAGIDSVRATIRIVDDLEAIELEEQLVDGLHILIQRDGLQQIL
ncbi:MAG: hypothetical protein KJO07_09060 [Deltaproteobacteria bacterium]|nr:hypothetical protein [Deltaproteobacteria bacterium]